MQETMSSRGHDQRTRPNQRPNLPYEEPTRHALPQVEGPAAEVVAHIPSRRPTPKKRLPLSLGVAGGGVAALIIVILVGLVSFVGMYHLNGWIYPGVTVGDIRLSGMTQSEAAAVLTTAWSTDEAITLRDGERTWQANPQDFGFAIDAAATAERAYRQRGIGVFTTATLNGVQIEPVVTVDEETAAQGLTAWAETIVDVEPTNATITINGAEVQAVAGQPGRALDVPATLDALRTNPGQALLGGQLILAVDEVSPAIDDASPFVAQAESMLAQPLTLSAYDPIANERVETNIEPEVVAGWLTITETESGPQIGVHADRMTTSDLGEQLGTERYLDGSLDADTVLAALTDGHQVTLPVGYNATIYTVVAGDTLYRVAWKTGMPYWRIVEANPGIDENGLDVGDQIQIPPKTDLIPLPVVDNKRIRVDISDQYMWVYEDGAVIREFVISTGIADSPTQPGVFQMQTFDDWAYASNWDLYMPEFIGIYEAWPGFMNGFHGLPTLSSGQILWKEILGSPASYGCIILDLPDSEWLWGWAEEGVIVEITE